MSYLATTKQLLGDDLNNLISTVTQLEKGTSEFSRLEEFAWHQILEKYHTSVTDDHVKNCINGFVEKFLFHGFIQKAENLKNLISYYSNLEYFKNKADGTIKWSLILLLIRLSQRPTDALDDDPPLVIEDLLRVEKEAEPDFDWTAYLKEGWEKFRIPSDEESLLFSDEDDRRNDFDLDDIPAFREATSPNRQLAKKEAPSKPKLSLEESERLCEENISDLSRWVDSHRETPWWRDTMFSENLTGQRAMNDYCHLWMKCMKEKGKSLSDVKIIGEHRIIQEIIYVLGTANGSSTYLFDCKNGVYLVKSNVSVSSLSPMMFHAVMESRFCRYLPNIATLILFVSNVSEKNSGDHAISDTYLAYSKAISDVLNNFRIELAAIEKLWNVKDSTITLRTISHRLQPWLDCLEFLSFIHAKAIYPNFNNIEPWKCSLRLLSVLLNEMKLISNSRFKKLTLGIFLNSFEIYLRIIGSMIKGMRNCDHKNEFLIYECPVSNVLNVQKYAPYLWEQNISPTEFWDPFISSCYRAISSTHFIGQLNKRSTFRKMGIGVDVLLADVIDGLKECISKTTVIREETSSFRSSEKMEEKNKPIKFSPLQTSNGWCQKMEGLFYKRCESQGSTVQHETPTDRFMKCLQDSNLTNFPISVFITKVFTSVIHKYMEPVGFAFDALINEFKLLDHLRCLRRVFFIQILEPFIFSLFQKVVKKSQRSCDWTSTLRDSILERYDQKTADQYQCFVGQISLIDDSNPKFVHDSLSFARIVYCPEVYLKVLIPDSCVKAYNEIFRFLLQVKWAHYIITKQFYFRGVQETHEKASLFKRMYLLRMRLVNTMSYFRNYFFSMDEDRFEDKIKKLCVEARDLQTIQRAHKDFLLECKLRCFLNRRNECRILVDALLVLSFKCVKLWWFRDKMMSWDLELLEEEYLRTTLKLVTQLQKYEQEFFGFSRIRLSLLQNELSANLPRSLPSKVASGLSVIDFS